MRVTLDGLPAAFGWSGCASLGDLARRAEEACFPQGQILTALTADGQELDLGDREPWTSRPLEGVEELALKTTRLARLLAETLDEMKQHFPALREELRKVAEGLRGGQEAKALESLGRVVTLWEACLAVASDAGAALGRTADHADQLEQLRGAILPLDEALRRRDLVLVADLCAYELPPLVDRWEEVLEALRVAAGA